VGARPSDLSIVVLSQQRLRFDSPVDRAPVNLHVLYQNNSVWAFSLMIGWRFTNSGRDAAAFVGISCGAVDRFETFGILPLESVILVLLCHAIAAYSA